MVKVSIVTRTINRPSLQRVIEDVKNQTYPNIEHIIIEGFDRFHAADEGFKKVTGDIVLLLDDDDRIESNHVEVAINSFTPELYYINTGFKIDKSGIKLPNMPTVGEEFKIGKSVLFTHNSCIFFRAELLKEFSYINPEYNCPCEDAAFFMDIALKYPGKFIGTYTSTYHVTGNNTSGLVIGKHYIAQAGRKCYNHVKGIMLKKLNPV